MFHQRRFAVVLFVGAACAWIGAGCTPGSNVPQQIAACSGNFTGTFTGIVSGTVSGTLAADGTLALTFVPTDPSALGLSSFSYNITGINTASFDAVNPNDIGATFNFDNCTLSGVWSFNGSSGSWSVSKS